MPLNFFKAYPIFIKIKICINKEEHIDQVRGYLESKLKHLVFEFENNETDANPIEQLKGYTSVHPWPESVPSLDQYYTFSFDYYFGLHIRRRKFVDKAAILSMSNAGTDDESTVDKTDEESQK